jgi:hypothetical protein
VADVPSELGLAPTPRNIGTYRMHRDLPLLPPSAFTMWYLGKENIFVQTKEIFFSCGAVSRSSTQRQMVDK